MPNLISAVVLFLATYITGAVVVGDHQGPIQYTAPGPGQIAAHLAIALAYLLAALRVAPTIARLMKIRGVTTISGAAFFICSSVSNLSVGLDIEDTWPIAINDNIKAVAIWVFILAFAYDVKCSVTRLAKVLRLLGFPATYLVDGALRDTLDDVDYVQIPSQEKATSRIAEGSSDVPRRDEA